MLTKTITLNDETERLTAEELTVLVNDSKIKVVAFFDHKKASERYVIIAIGTGNSRKEWYLPYFYRRTNLFIDTKDELVEYIRFRVPQLSSAKIRTYRLQTAKTAKGIIGEESDVTWPIFERLLNNCGEWVWNKEFGENSNPQRRIQAIKELGYTLATRREGRKTFHSLLPFERKPAPTYEKISAKVRKAIFKAHGGVDAFSGNRAPLSALPDHKFPEIRWEASTPESNDSLSESEMREKFQLVPEWVNQKKREACRKCFQSKRRGKLNGVDFYYCGQENWPSNVPATGSAAKNGCVGCFWYDMIEWRKQLNKLIKGSSVK